MRLLDRIHHDDRPNIELWARHLLHITETRRLVLPCAQNLDLYKSHSPVAFWDILARRLHHLHLRRAFFLSDAWPSESYLRRASFEPNFSPLFDTRIREHSTINRGLRRTGDRV